MSDENDRPSAADWAEEFYKNREDIYRLLDRVAEERLHDPKSAKQMLKSLITEFRNGEDIFNILYFSIVDKDEEFMSDIEGNVDDEIYDAVNSLMEEYERISNELKIAYHENILYLNNPMVTVEAEVTSIGGSGSPLIRLVGYTGEMKLFESTDYLVNHVRTSAEILNEAVNAAEDYTENYAGVEELTDLAGQPDHIEMHVKELRDLINESDPDALENADTEDYHE